MQVEVEVQETQSTEQITHQDQVDQVVVELRVATMQMAQTAQPIAVVAVVVQEVQVQVVELQLLQEQVVQELLWLLLQIHTRALHQSVVV
jgi:hypothetical protein